MVHRASNWLLAFMNSHKGGTAVGTGLEHLPKSWVLLCGTYGRYRWLALHARSRLQALAAADGVHPGRSNWPWRLHKLPMTCGFGSGLIGLRRRWSANEPGSSIMPARLANRSQL
jgi:fumarate hydratase class II